MSHEPADVTMLLRRIRNGERAAESLLMTAVFPELVRIARRVLRSEPRGHSLEPTILVSEVYVRAIRSTAIDWEDREHLNRVAVRVMRHVLVDHARAKGAGRRPPPAQRAPFDDVVDIRNDDNLEDIVAVHEAIDQLEQEDPQLAALIELRYFGGYTVDEIATKMQIAKSTTDKRLTFARAWLGARLTSPRSNDGHGDS